MGDNDVPGTGEGEASLPSGAPRTARGQWSGTWIGLIACALAVTATVLVVILVADGDEQPTLRDVALYAPDDTAGLPLLRAVTGAELGPSSDNLGHVVVYGEDNDLRGRVMVVSSTVAEGSFDIGAHAPDREQVVDINGVDGLLIKEPGSDVITLSWQPVGVRLNAVNARFFDESEVVAAARAVTGSLGSIELPNPERFGLRAIVLGSMEEFALAPGFEPGYGGALLAYGDAEGGPQLIVVTGGGDFAVPTMRVLYDDARDFIIDGDEGISALLGPDPEDRVGAIVSWREEDGAVIRVVGLGIPRDTVEAVAQTVHLISSEEFLDLAEQARAVG